jgi:UDP-glucose 4-epimerase
MKKKILVTGGAGYIGSHTIVELLNSNQYEVISIDNFINSNALTFDYIYKITGQRIQNLPIDLCDFDAVHSFFENNLIDGIIHFAALKSVPESVSNPLLYYHNNITSLTNILLCVEKFNIRNFVFSSSCAVYGDIESLPVVEGLVLQPKSPYANTKLIGEKILEDLANTNKHINSMSLRYFNPVGADKSGLIGENKTSENLFQILCKTASGDLPFLTIYGNDYATKDGTCIRDYIHVSDIAKAHVHALEYLFTTKDNFLQRHEIVNLGTGYGLSVNEIIQTFEQVTRIKINTRYGQRRQGDIAAIYSDTKKAEKILHWKAQNDIAKMVESSWNWYSKTKLIRQL